jgi:hypothetical protein
VSLNRIQREIASPSTPSIRNVRPPPGPSPLSLKRSVSFGNVSSVDRPRKRRTRSSDVFQKRVSSLLEQAQIMYNDEEVSTSSLSETDTARSEADAQINSPNPNLEHIAFDGDLDLLEAEMTLDLSSDGLQKMDVDDKMVSKEAGSDDSFDNEFGEFEPEELEALFSSDAMVLTAQPETGIAETVPVVDEYDAVFGDDDDYMDLDFDDTQPEVFKSQLD